MEVNHFLDNLLSDFNDRDTDADQNRLGDILECLKSGSEEVIALKFGGSIRKHTYIDGLSDVDVLAIITAESVGGRTPQEVLRRFADRLSEELSGAEITVGKLAVTATFQGGREIQILPALSTPTGVRIADVSGTGWSTVVRPDAFAKKLTAVNQVNANRVVPVIKLFKALVDRALPADAALSGYHAESLAIEAFKSYQGAKSYKAMLLHLCEISANRVLTPIRDSTGQSVHVDDYLGSPNSQGRRQLSTRLNNLSKTLANADRRLDSDIWRSLLGAED